MAFTPLVLPVLCKPPGHSSGRLSASPCLFQMALERSAEKQAFLNPAMLARLIFGLAATAAANKAKQLGGEVVDIAKEEAKAYAKAIRQKFIPSNQEFIDTAKQLREGVVDFAKEQARDFGRNAKALGYRSVRKLPLDGPGLARAVYNREAIFPLAPRISPEEVQKAQQRLADIQVRWGDIASGVKDRAQQGARAVGGAVGDAGTWLAQKAQEIGANATQVGKRIGQDASAAGRAVIDAMGRIRDVGQLLPSGREYVDTAKQIGQMAADDFPHLGTPLRNISSALKAQFTRVPRPPRVYAPTKLTKGDLALAAVSALGLAGGGVGVSRLLEPPAT